MGVTIVSRSVQPTSKKAASILMNKTNLKQIDKENASSAGMHMTTSPYSSLIKPATSGISSSVNGLTSASTANQPPVKIRTLI